MSSRERARQSNVEVGISQGLPLARRLANVTAIVIHRYRLYYMRIAITSSGSEKNALSLAWAPSPSEARR